MKYANFCMKLSEHPKNVNESFEEELNLKKRKETCVRCQLKINLVSQESCNQTKCFLVDVFF